MTVMSLNAIIDQIWETGEWSEDSVMSKLLITLPKHRTVNRISHSAKIALEVVGQFIAPDITEELFGFRASLNI